MLRFLNISWGHIPLGFYRHSTLHWNSLSSLLALLQISAEMLPSLESLPRRSQVGLTTPSSIPTQNPNTPPRTLHCFCLLLHFCPTRAGGICILSISNFKPLSGLIRSCLIWFLPPLHPFSCHSLPRPLYAVTLAFRLFQRSSNSFLILGLCFCSNTPNTQIFLWLASSWHSDLCSNLTSSRFLPWPTNQK